ncbi:AT-rich interactive domain-containing protein 4B [Thrips palmi]|uniref:AT-rich interactive domain-containing protein 4B n=1 Tax=Thrips palmi TaxID=161013 RepID=A0A6P8YP89_THRPL|nr:AT-rich interactive domain-containing protein 4B [Thrips palmi]
MLRWPNNQGVMGDDPPYLVVGTEVSAKYKGAFCEAKVRKVVRTVKCKVNFKVGGSTVVTDDQIRGNLRIGSVVEVKHPDRKEFVEASITKIQDCSQYTVVFDDGDITTLRRTALCLKSGRHFAESETLDQLPLTHPEHFGNPVVGSRRGGRRSRNPMSDESSEEEEEPPKGKSKEEKEADIGKVVCVELGDKKKQKDNWFPGLVVHPAAQEVVRIRVKDEYLVRSFKDGRYYTVPKKEATEFTREIGLKVDNNILKSAVDKALQYLDKDELPPHWDRELLFGLDDASTASDSDAAFDSDSSDDEPREEKDHFVAQLYKFMDDRGTPINRGPSITGRDVDLYKLFKVVHKIGGCNRVTNHNQWKIVSHKIGFGQYSNTANLVKGAYKKYLHSFEDFYRKLGCTMVNHPRGNRPRHKGGRSLIRDKDRSTPVNVPRGDNKDKGSDTVDEDDDMLEKSEEGAELSLDEKDEEISKPKEVKEPEVVAKMPTGPSPPERKLLDPQLKISTPKGKPKKMTEGSCSKNVLDSKKKIVVTKIKGARAIDDDHDDEMEMLDVEDLDEEDEDKLTTTRSKSKDDSSRLKVEKSVAEGDKKARSIEGSERRIKPSLTATAEKRLGRPSLTTVSDKKAKGSQDNDRKTVRSLAAEFEKKSRGLEVDKKEASSSDSDKKPRSYSVSDSEKKIRPSLTATLERKKSSVLEIDKKSRQSGTDSEKKIRPSLSVDLERKKVRPSLTADPMKKVSRLDSDRKKEKSSRSSDADNDMERKSKLHDSDRKNSSSESSRHSSGDSDKRVPKSDSGDSEKRGNSKTKKGDDDKKKLQARKRKDNDDPAGSTDDNLDLLPNYKNVCIGDKLKVYYGPTHESKVTYEAKVLEVEGGGQEESYLVHYTGWNNRYDEWIKRSRIADNLSWSPARGKRRHQAQVPGAKKSSVKGSKRILTPARDGASPFQKDQSQAAPAFPGVDKCRDSQPPRCSTPSSVTSSSSRTKSPAMRPGSARVTRNTIGDMSQVDQPTRRTRTRRISGQTDVPSESESDASESESEAEPSVTRKSSRRLALEKEEETSRKDSSTKKKQQKRDTEIDPDEDEKDGDKDDLKDDVKDEDEASSETLSEGKFRLNRPRKSKGRKSDVKVEVEEDEETSSTQVTRGRDFDLNQIRSELKGIDKSVRASSPTSDEKDQKTDSDTEQDADVDVDTPSLEEKPCSLFETEDSALDTEDIYEFKEPEPFEFEVRSKRESSVERTGKLQKRPLPRLFDDISEPAVKRKAVRAAGAESESSEEGLSPSKKRVRRPVNKKDDLDVKVEAHSPPPDINMEKNTSTEQLTPQKKMFSPTSEDAFEKLRQSPSYRFSAGSPIRARTPTPSRSSPVPVPLQSPPSLSSSSSVISSSTVVKTPTSSVLSIVGHTSATAKAAPVLKQVTTPQSPKATPTCPSSSMKPLPQESKLLGKMKPLLPPPQNVSVPSQPPVLAVAVKVPTENRVITKTEDWLKNRQQAQEKSESSKTEQTPVKPERDDSLPPLVPTALSIPVTGRVSPEPPQLLPMSVPAPKLIQEPSKSATKDVQMPMIKKEGVALSDIVGVSSPRPVQPVTTGLKSPAGEDTPDDLSEDDSLKKAGRRKPLLKRKKAVSKEFVEDSDSDSSSDEETRLVIDKTESSSDSSNESVETKLTPPVREFESKWRALPKVGDLPKDSCNVQQTVSVTKKEDTSRSTAEEHQPSGVLAVAEVVAELEEDADADVETETETEAEADMETEVEADMETEVVTEDISPIVKTEDGEEPEGDNNLCSLLCEETIPGSPAPLCDTPIDVHTEASSSRASDRPSENTKTSCKVLEMPFASVPGNTRSSGPSTSTNSASVQFVNTSAGEKAENLSDMNACPSKAAPDVGPGAASEPPAAAPSTDEATPVIDNTPPTTPDSSMSTLSNSPRGEHGDTLSILDNDSMKSLRDSEDAENKDNDFSDDDLDVGSRMKKLSEKKENERKGRCDTDSVSMSPASHKKRRRSRKGSESEDRSKRPRHSSSRLRGQATAGSDSDDNRETLMPIIPTSQSQSQPTNQSLQLPSSSLMTAAQAQSGRSPRPSKYNFFVELTPELDASQRIALLQNTLQDLRKTYANVKQELACIDRRRKKLRRREREEKASKQEISCA